jgi:hypothetical protein
LPIRFAWGRLLALGTVTSGATLILVSDLPLAVVVLAAVLASLVIASSLPVRLAIRGVAETIAGARGGRRA